MKRQLILFMMLSLTLTGSAVFAQESLSNTLFDAANKINKIEQGIENAKKDSQTKQKAREEAAQIKKQEWEQEKERAKKEFKEKYDIKQKWEKEQEQSKKEWEAKKRAKQEEYQKKKEAWNTLFNQQ